MRDRAARIKSLLLSPGVSIAVALIGLIELTGYRDWWLPAALSAAVGALMVYEIKARTLYRGPNFPFIGLFMLLQAAVNPTLTGCLTAAVAAMAMTALFLCFSRPGETRTIYLIGLFCGVGALGARCFLMLAGALLTALVLVRAFSMRGLVASLLGLLTPLIILGGFGLYNPDRLIEIYSGPWLIGFNLPTLSAGAIAAMFAIAMFLPSYGYTAKARARNMAMLGLTAWAIALPILDSVHHTDYLPLVNLCAAYNVSHFAATRRFGWIGAMAVSLLAVGLYFGY